MLMTKLQSHAKSHLKTNKITFHPAKYPLLEETHDLTLALIVIGIGCDVLPGGVSGGTALSISNQLKKMKEDGINEDNHEIRCVRLIEFFYETR